jgi:hypothetical protein
MPAGSRSWIESCSECSGNLHGTPRILHREEECREQTIGIDDDLPSAFAAVVPHILRTTATDFGSYSALTIEPISHPAIHLSQERSTAAQHAYNWQRP